MRDWNSPAEIERDEVYLTTILYVCGGCAIWEYITQLPFEWDVVRRVRRYRWTIWVYSSCRISMVLGFILLIGAANGWSSQRCTASYVAAQALSYASLGLASLLIVLRIVAVWERHMAIVIVSYAIWLIGVVLNVRDLSLLRASFSAIPRTCEPYNTSRFLPNSIGIIGSDVSLLALVLVGILRKREAPKFGVVRLLYHQGVVWLAAAVIVETPVLIFCILNLNAPLTLLFQPVELVTLGICAGRMYRGLMSYTPDHGSNDIPLRDVTPVRPWS
ncbi:unnamed protein product [Peniophora sp. CBMAI 1063]|nr:unnamed protein product [Peniophora sp. CBMAI 1063]